MGPVVASVLLWGSVVGFYVVIRLLGEWITAGGEL
jgi:hypothetical protein